MCIRDRGGTSPRDLPVRHPRRRGRRPCPAGGRRSVRQRLEHVPARTHLPCRSRRPRSQRPGSQPPQHRARPAEACRIRTAGRPHSGVGASARPYPTGAVSSSGPPPVAAAASSMRPSEPPVAAIHFVRPERDSRPITSPPAIPEIPRSEHDMTNSTNGRGPIPTRRDMPRLPRETTATTVTASPATTPESPPISEVSSNRARRRGATALHAAMIPAATPTRSHATRVQRPLGSVGTAPKTGTAGSRPSCVIVGEITEPSPKLMPAPITHEAPHTTRFGRYAISPSIRTKPPAGSAPSEVDSSVIRPRPWYSAARRATLPPTTTVATPAPAAIGTRLAHEGQVRIASHPTTLATLTRLDRPARMAAPTLSLIHI